MTKHPILEKLQDKLKHFYTEFRHKNVMEVSLTKNDQLFAILIMDSKYPDMVMLSLTVEPFDPMIVAELVYTVMHCEKMGITEPFYQDQLGRIFLGDEALDRFDLDLHIDLKQINPPTDLRH
jgi:hypothetical protein